LTDRLERDIGRILHRIDIIEHIVNRQNRFHPMTAITPPESDHESRPANHSRVLSRSSDPAGILEEAEAIDIRSDSLERHNSTSDSPSTCLVFDLHKAANIPYIFADLFKHELDSTSVPFALHCPLPVHGASEQEIDAYFGQVGLSSL
jgi:hypothetical protein